MRAWLLPAGSTGYGDLYQADLPDPQPGAGEVLIAPRAWSINFRDFVVAAGRYRGGPPTRPAVPLSDGAGEVLAVGEGVTGFAAGDRVQGSFALDWLDGPQVPSRSLGDGHGPGMLAEQVVLPQQAVVAMADSLDYAQAACLPCAGVTAWNALTRGRPLQRAERVLVMGSGGVSTLALLLAKALGAEVIATSSSDEKLARLKQLGADQLINYSEVPEWGALVSSRFGGAHQIVEVGGAGTLEQSMAALAGEAEIAMIGVLARAVSVPSESLTIHRGAVF